MKQTTKHEDEEAALNIRLEITLQATSSLLREETGE
jgi:hypothetical protein